MFAYHLSEVLARISAPQLCGTSEEICDSWQQQFSSIRRGQISSGGPWPYRLGLGAETKTACCAGDGAFHLAEVLQGAVAARRSSAQVGRCGMPPKPPTVLSTCSFLHALVQTREMHSLEHGSQNQAGASFVPSPVSVQFKLLRSQQLHT